MRFLEILGSFILFLRETFNNRVKGKILFQRFIEECVEIGLKSTVIIVVISVFVGAVCCIQINNVLRNPILSKSMVSVGLKNMVMLELSSTLSGIIFAGKIGCDIASQIETMKITEQIDALNIMGVNSNSYIACPKIMASVVMFPLLVILSTFTALFVGYLVGINILHIPSETFLLGYKLTYNPRHIPYVLEKSICFSFLISSISAFCGYKSSKIGTASKMSFTYSCIFVLIADYILTTILL